jgi:cytochrome P450
MSVSTTTTGAPYGFDLQSPEYLANPYPFYARLRAEAPVAFIEPRWILTRYEDVATILRNPVFGRGGYDDIILRAFGPGPLHASFTRWMLFMDPPNHTRLRSLATRAFTPRAVEQMRLAIQRLVDQLLDTVERDGGGDLIASFAYPLPVLVICELLGVPPDDRDEFRTWSDSLGRALQLTRATPEIVAAGNEAADRLTEYFRDLVAEHRGQPHDDLLGALVVAEDEHGRLTEDELLATAVLLFFAGHETTVNLIGNGALHLLREPEQWQLLRDDPALARNAVEEVLRFDSPVQLVGRVALADAEIDGIPIAAGQMVTGMLGGANRDPARFPDPDRLDIRRADTQHLSFAAGAHYCLGAALARLEGEIAFTTLTRRFPTMRLATETLTWRQNLVLRGLQTLRVSC